jgi:hypothetical protein
LVERMNFLKQEKTACITEIPEIKKDLEHCREDYEMAVKRDKEFEKQFKKEFHGNEFHYDALWRLFKRRDHHVGKFQIIYLKTDKRVQLESSFGRD